MKILKQILFFIVFFGFTLQAEEIDFFEFVKKVQTALSTVSFQNISLDNFQPCDTPQCLRFQDPNFSLQFFIHINSSEKKPLLSFENENSRTLILPSLSFLNPSSNEFSPHLLRQFLFGHHSYGSSSVKRGIDKATDPRTLETAESLPTGSDVFDDQDTNLKALEEGSNRETGKDFVLTEALLSQIQSSDKKIFIVIAHQPQSVQQLFSDIEKEKRGLSQVQAINWSQAPSWLIFEAMINRGVESDETLIFVITSQGLIEKLNDFETQGNRRRVYTKLIQNLGGVYIDEAHHLGEKKVVIEKLILDSQAFLYETTATSSVHPQEELGDLTLEEIQRLVQEYIKEHPDFKLTVSNFNRERENIHPRMPRYEAIYQRYLKAGIGTGKSFQKWLFEKKRLLSDWEEIQRLVQEYVERNPDFKLTQENFNEERTEIHPRMPTYQALYQRYLKADIGVGKNFQKWLVGKELPVSELEEIHGNSAVKRDDQITDRRASEIAESLPTGSDGLDDQTKNLKALEEGSNRGTEKDFVLTKALLSQIQSSDKKIFIVTAHQPQSVQQLFSEIEKEKGGLSQVQAINWSQAPSWLVFEAMINRGVESDETLIFVITSQGLIEKLNDFETQGNRRRVYTKLIQNLGGVYIDEAHHLGEKKVVIEKLILDSQAFLYETTATSSVHPQEELGKLILEEIHGNSAVKRGDQITDHKALEEDSNRGTGRIGTYLKRFLLGYPYYGNSAVKRDVPTTDRKASEIAKSLSTDSNVFDDKIANHKALEEDSNRGTGKDLVLPKAFFNKIQSSDKKIFIVVAHQIQSAHQLLSEIEKEKEKQGLSKVQSINWNQALSWQNFELMINQGVENDETLIFVITSQDLTEKWNDFKTQDNRHRVYTKLVQNLGEMYIEEVYIEEIGAYSTNEAVIEKLILDSQAFLYDTTVAFVHPQGELGELRLKEIQRLVQEYVERNPDFKLTETHFDQERENIHSRMPRYETIYQSYLTANIGEGKDFQLWLFEKLSLEEMPRLVQKHIERNPDFRATKTNFDWERKKIHPNLPRYETIYQSYLTANIGEGKDFPTWLFGKELSLEDMQRLVQEYMEKNPDFKDTHANFNRERKNIHPRMPTFGAIYGRYMKAGIGTGKNFQKWLFGKEPSLSDLEEIQRLVQEYMEENPGFQLTKENFNRERKKIHLGMPTYQAIYQRYKKSGKGERFPTWLAGECKRTITSLSE